MTPHETKPSVSQEELKSQAGNDLILQHMVAKKMPLTRETYLNLNYPEGAPNPMPAGLEMEIPEIFRETHSLASSMEPHPMQAAADAYEAGVMKLITEKLAKEPKA